MKTLALLFLAAVASARAAYTLDWLTMDGGAGRGAAGSFAMQSTLGQPDIATGSAGSFVFVGGYWSLVDEPLPLLRIFQEKAGIVLAWPNPSDGFHLQTSPNLLPSTWADVAVQPVIVGSEKQVTWGQPSGQRFFRLRRP